LVGDAFAFQPLFQRSVARKVRSGETLMATLRFSRVSRARYTSPMPGRGGRYDSGRIVGKHEVTRYFRVARQSLAISAQRVN